MIVRKGFFACVAAAGLALFLGGQAIAQWPTDIRIDKGGDGFYKSNTYVARSGNNVYACWKDYRDSTDNGTIYATYSHDGGATWAAQDSRVDLGKVAGSSISDWPAIACSGNNVYVVWEDYRNDPSNSAMPNIYFNRSIDSGQTWDAQDQRIDTGAPANDTLASHVGVAAYGSNVYVCWEDERSGVPNVYFSMSDSYGAAGTWTAPVGVDPVGGQYYKQQYPVMATTGNRVYIGWEDNRDTDLNVYMNHSKDGGRTWDPNNVRRVDTDNPWGGDSMYIVIAATTVESGGGNMNGISPGGVSYKLHGASGETGATWKKPPQSRDLVYFFWRDYRNSQGSFMLDVYFNYSHDGGLTWGNPDQRMNTDHATPGTFWVGEPAIAASEKGVYVVWLDEKDDINPGSSPYIDDVYINISHTGGLPGNWSGPRRMDQGTSPGTVDSWHPKVAASWPYTWVTWMDERDDPVNFYDSVYCSHSTNAGINWTYSERVDSGGSSPGAKYAEINAEGNVLDVIYYDWRYNQKGVFYNTRSF